jgi:Zn-dependent peptidase ImmA (M78 family)
LNSNKQQGKIASQIANKRNQLIKAHTCIGEKEKPEILINSDSSEVRKKFTLAHELGHVIIPWHTGTIVSHTDADNDEQLEWEYREVEAEANRFAAELLMPTDWIREIFNIDKNIESLINRLMNDSHTSLDAILIKIFKALKYPVLLFEYNYKNEIINKVKTVEAPYIDENILIEENPFSMPHTLEKFSIKTREFIAVTFDFNSLEFKETDPREWREILNEILTCTSLENEESSVNAILGFAFNSLRNLSYEEKCRNIMKSFEGRAEKKVIVRHDLFLQYVIKRVIELTNKQEI